MNIQQDYITFSDYKGMKVMKKALNVQQEVIELRKKPQHSKKRVEEVEAQLILTYFQKFDIINIIHQQISNMYLDKQVPNPFPGLILFLEAKALEKTVFSVPEQDFIKAVYYEVNENHIAKRVKFDSLDNYILKKKSQTKETVSTPSETREFLESE